METEEEIDIVMKVEVEENPLTEPEDFLLETNETDKLQESIKKMRVYLNVKAEEYDKKVNDIQDKLNIAQNVMQACKNNEPLNVTPIEKLHKYTKLPISGLVGVINEDAPKLSLTKAIVDTAPIPSCAATFIYNDIREVFIECFVRMKQMPSVTDFIESLTTMRDVEYYKDLNITKLVANNLVKYHYFPKLNSYILTENPELSYKRHLYLKQILQYRHQSIVYVAVLSITTCNSLHYLLLAASSTGLLTKLKYIKNFKNWSLENQVKWWIQNELTPTISTKSVVVLMQSEKSDTPTIHSSRADMIQWLDRHFVPHDDTSHRSDLYNLIKLSKKKFKATGYEEVLESNGFKVLICPMEYQNLDLFNAIRTHETENDPSQGTVVNMVKMISKYEWGQMEKQLIEMEKKILKEDEEMNMIVQNIFQMVKSGDLQEEDFPDNCRATKADNFAVNIGDIIIE